MDYKDKICKWLETYESVYLVFTASPEGDLITPDKKGLLELELMGMRLKNFDFVNKLWNWEVAKKCLNPFSVEKAYSIWSNDFSDRYSIGIDKYFECYVISKK